LLSRQGMSRRLQLYVRAITVVPQVNLCLQVDRLWVDPDVRFQPAEKRPCPRSMALGKGRYKLRKAIGTE
jgi:hypothetical protein